jgi:hypothetical protein
MKCELRKKQAISVIKLEMLGHFELDMSKTKDLLFEHDVESVLIMFVSPHSEETANGKRDVPDILLLL